MSKYLSLFLLFTTITATTINSPAPSPSITQSPPVITHSPPPPPVITQSPPPPVITQSPPPPRSPPVYIQQQQLRNIIDALIGAGDFSAWANILFNPAANLSMPTSTTTIPSTATLFVPGNDALSHLTTTATGAYSFDPFIIPYHILPQRLTFSELQLFKTQTRIPTLLLSKTIIITNNTPTNFTIDDSLITQPNIYTNDAVCVHGIANILDYTVYGESGQTPALFLPPPPMPLLQPADETVTPPSEVVSSMGLVSSADFLIILFLIFFAYFDSILN